MERSRSTVVATSELSDTLLLEREATCSSSEFSSYIVPAGTSYAYTEDETQNTDDVVTPNFKSRIASGEIINNPFTSVRDVEVYPQPGSYHHVYNQLDGFTDGNGVKHDITHDISGLYVPSTVPDFISGEPLYDKQDDIVDLAVTQAHANIDVSEMMALASAAEGRKTIESIFSILLRVKKIMQSVRRLDIRRLKRELSHRELEDRYMELRYALRPLIYEAQGVASALNTQREHARRTFRGYSEGTWELDDDVSTSFHWWCNATWNRKIELEISARAGVLCDVQVNSINIFGVDQLIETMWELTPFSFIIDWFLNIGDTIAAWTPNAGVTQRASWVTVRQKRTLTNQVTGVSSTAGNNTGYENVSASYSGCIRRNEELVLKRIVSPTVSVFPSVDFRLDAFKLTDLGIILKRLTS